MNMAVAFTLSFDYQFLACLHFSAEELYRCVSVRVGVHMQNVRLNVKILEF